MIFVHCGSFVFEALQSAKFDKLPIVTDENGSLLRHDTRIWHSQTIMVFDRVGFGLSTSCPDLGLHVDFVRQATTMLLTFVPNPDGFLIIGIVRIATGWKQCFGPSLYNPPQEGKTYLFCYLFDEHWALCTVRIPVAECAVGHFHLDFADGFRHRVVPSRIWQFATFLEDLWFLDCTQLQIVDALWQTKKHTCGTVLLGYVAQTLGLLHPQVIPHLEDLHAGLAILSVWNTDCDLSFCGFGKRTPQEQSVLHQLEVFLKGKRCSC